MKRSASLIVTLSILNLPSAAFAQNCVDGQPIRPTWTLAGYRYGQLGVSLAGSDLFIAAEVNSGTVTVMRPNETNGYSQAQVIQTGYISNMRAAVDTLVVGNSWSTSNGAVRIYRKQTTGLYALGATLTGPVTDESFGDRVALSEDALTLAVGAPYAGAGPTAGSGKVYIYTRQSSGTWALLSTLTPVAGSVGNALFGYRVSVSGTRVAVAESNSQWGYVFVRTGSTYVQEARVTHSAPVGNTSNDICLSADWMWFRKGGSRLDAFQLSGSSWVFKQTLILASTEAIDFKNGLLAVSDQVSSPTWTIRVRGYQRQGAQMMWTNFFTATPSVALDDSLTSWLAIDGDRIVVDAPRLDFGSVSDYGAAFLFDAVFNDCNGNGTRDECDIALTTSADSNSNGVPDECESLCAADVNSDGVIDGVDLTYLLSGWGACPP